MKQYSVEEIESLLERIGLSALCVCCSHCQRENERLRKALRECIGKTLLYTYAEGERCNVNQINRINGEIKHIAQKALVEING